MKTFRKVAFTLAECTTHVDMSDNISDNVTNFVEGATHVDICDSIRKCAFTLAEVLITLSIIGVVAALTLPPLIQHHNKVVWVNQLKKSVNTLENGFKLLLAEDGVDKLKDTSIWPDTTCSKYANCPEFFEGLRKYFNISVEQYELPEKSIYQLSGILLRRYPFNIFLIVLKSLYR